eukprot:g3605.t1
MEPPRARVRLLAKSLLDPGSGALSASLDAGASSSSSSSAGNAARTSPLRRSPRRPLYNNGFNAGSTPQKKPCTSGPAAQVVNLDASTSRLRTCHQINTLFRSQPSFSHAEALASEFFKLAATNSRCSTGGDDPTCVGSSPPLHMPLLEAILDTLEDSSELAHVPCEVLANFALYAPFRQAMVVGEAAEIVLALLRATRVGRVRLDSSLSERRESHDRGKNTVTAQRDNKAGANSEVLLASVATDLLLDLVETDGSAKWFPLSLKKRVASQLSKQGTIPN